MKIPHIECTQLPIMVGTPPCRRRIDTQYQLLFVSNFLWQLFSELYFVPYHCDSTVGSAYPGLCIGPVACSLRPWFATTFASAFPGTTTWAGVTTRRVELQSLPAWLGRFDPLRPRSANLRVSSLTLSLPLPRWFYNYCCSEIYSQEELLDSMFPRIQVHSDASS